MKKNIVASIFVVFVTICSCQKQNSSADQQLVRRQTALDIRETGLEEREKALDEREKLLSQRERALAEREKAIANLLPRSGQTPDAVQAKAELQRRIEQLPPEVRALVPDPAKLNSINFEKNTTPTATDAAQLKAETEKRIQQLPPEFRALIPDRAVKNSINIDKQLEMLRKSGISGKTISPTGDSVSPNPSPTPQ
jgi:myosin heavy subunit